ncbi:MAG: type II secretion system F family protein [bacterium]|nr:type II secretion system F family protein [bacterium]
MAGKPKKKSLLKINIPRPISQKDIAVFSRSLSLLIDVGVPLLRSLRILSERTNNPRLAKIVKEIADHVEGGGSLSGGLAKYPRIFRPLIISLIRVGETGGVLESSLRRIAEMLENRIALTSKIRSAMMYPTVAITASLGVVIFLLTYVIPIFVPLFQKKTQGQVNLPLPTQIILTTSDFLRNQWAIYVPLLIIIIIALIIYGRTASGKLLYDRIRLRVWLIGPIFTKLVIARFARTLATLLRSGIGLLEGLQIAKDSVGSPNVAEALEKTRAGIEAGGRMEDQLRDSIFFPGLAVDLIAVGEQAGQLETVLQRLAESYEQELDDLIHGMTSVIEPILIVFVGGIVLFIALSVFLPYFSLVKIIQ